LANKKSTIKRLRSAERRQLQNRIHRGQTRTAIKNARHAIAEGHLDKAQEAVRVAIKALDKAAQKNVIHKNNAARRKSRLMQQLNQAERAA